VVVDAAGNLFIGDAGNHRIRRLDAVTGNISTYAGDGVYQFAGDGGSATQASLSDIGGLAVDDAGNLYLCDGSDRVRKVDAATGIIATVAGGGLSGDLGDGGPATDATLYSPQGVAVDGAGNLFISDLFNHRIRRVDAATGVIETVVGTGERSFSGDGGPAISATLGYPGSIAMDGRGDLFITDVVNFRIRVVDRLGVPRNNAPVADAGADVTAECTAGGTAADLDGTGSSDPDGDALTYRWSGDFDGGVAAGARPRLVFAGGPGVHVVTLVVNDGRADSAPDTATVTIVDTTPPTLTVSNVPASLWPPNHKMVRIRPTVSVSDAGDPAPVITCSVTSSEPDDGLGDGDTAGDVVVHSANEVELRAERSGSGSGRVYTLTFTARDASGNVGAATAVVTVPVSQR
jgi:hypothetical protein